jgi:hypothetical protein
MKRIYNTDEMKDDESTSSSIKSDELSRASPLTKAGTVAFDALNESQKMKIYQLLSEWEEPDRHADEYVSLHPGPTFYLDISASLIFHFSPMLLYQLY